MILFYARETPVYLHKQYQMTEFCSTNKILIFLEVVKFEFLNVTVRSMLHTIRNEYYFTFPFFLVQQYYCYYFQLLIRRFRLPFVHNPFSKINITVHDCVDVKVYRIPESDKGNIFFLLFYVFLVCICYGDWTILNQQ